MNRTLREESPPVRCNRSMQKKTFEKKGVQYASELALQNISDLKRILKWNARHGIFFYRCTSKLFPWNLEYTVENLPDYEEIKTVAKSCGDFIKENGIRFTFHPNHYCKLASTSEETATRSAQDLANHGKWLDLMGLSRTPYYSINIHIGATYGDKQETAERFSARVNELPERASKRLTVENDDKDSLYGVKELSRSVSQECGIPVTFDYHHHKFTNRGLAYEEGYQIAEETWPCDPVVHLSEAECLRRGIDSRPQSHSEYVYEIPDWLKESSADIMLEANAKERAVLYHTM